ncbi:MAG: oxidoreductase [Porticoccaceae bacterium]|nr:MAG: oxidoreductase [Porticoccaceae bacterium]
MGGLLAGRVAIVTGGAGGLGEAAVRRFVEEGARVVIADLDEERGSALAAGLGEQSAFFRVDVARREEMEALVQFTLERFGDLQVMVNNAGFSGRPYGRFLEDDLADFGRVMEVNLLGVLLGCQVAGRHLARRGGGSIVNTASIGGIKPGMPLISYRAAKAAVIHATRSIARDLGEYGVRVNCIAPGHIPAGMTFYDVADTVRRMQALQRQGAPQDFANAALYFASDLSAQVTGAVLPVDGGACLGGPLESLKPA